MGSRVQSSVGCFPELCLLQFYLAQVLVGLRKQLTNNLVYPLGPVLLVLIFILIITAFVSIPTLSHLGHMLVIIDYYSCNG